MWCPAEDNGVRTALTAIAVCIAVVSGLCSCRPAGRQRAAGPAPGQSADGLLECRRIVSLAPSITEILFGLGLGERLVGVTRYCDFPAAALSKPKVGGYYDPSLEAIVALDPDVVILMKQQDGAIAQLNNMDIPLLQVDHSGIDGILDSFTAIGTRCGKAAEAERIVRHVVERMDVIANATRSLPRPRVLISVGHNMGTQTLGSLYIAGQDGFFSTLVEAAGGAPVYTNTTIKFPMVTKEGVIELNPEVIIDLVADLEDSPEARKSVLDLWRSLEGVQAVEDGRIHIFTEDYVTIPGPRFSLLLEKLASVLHPDLDLPESGD